MNGDVSGGYRFSSIGKYDKIQGNNIKEVYFTKFSTDANNIGDIRHEIE
jgi:hypothetical protein